MSTVEAPFRCKLTDEQRILCKRSLQRFWRDSPFFRAANLTGLDAWSERVKRGGRDGVLANVRARAEISGGREGVSGALRLTARRGVTVNVVPDDAMVYVNDTPIGEAKQLATSPYEFPQAGSYTIRITANGYKDRTFVVTASDAAPQELAAISVKLEHQ